MEGDDDGIFSVWISVALILFNISRSLTQPATAAHYFDKNDINVFTVRFGTSLQIELLTEPVARRMASL